MFRAEFGEHLHLFDAAVKEAYFLMASDSFPRFVQKNPNLFTESPASEKPVEIILLPIPHPNSAGDPSESSISFAQI
ncbi:hypothetical protein AAMO2058_001460200 [Amorphochlora amoebiformis]